MRYYYDLKMEGVHFEQQFKKRFVVPLELVNLLEDYYEKLKRGVNFMFSTRRISLMLILIMLVTIIGSSYALAYSYAGCRWQYNNTNYKYGSNLPSSYQTPIYTAAGTWNSDAADFTFYYNSSAYNVWGAANYGSAGGMLGLTTITGNGTTVIGANTDYNTYYSFSTNPSSSQYDLETVALHEFGHWLVLNDISSPTSAIMYFSLSSGQQKRTLTQDDSNGINYIY